MTGNNDLRFVSVEFVNDPNVKGNAYWYLCPYEVEVGDEVIAPLGRHNNTQTGTVRKVTFGSEYDSPFPLYLIKTVRKVLKQRSNDV